MPRIITSSPTGQSFFETLKNNEAFFFPNDLEGKEKVYACYFEFILLPELGYCNTERSHRHLDRTELTGLLVADKVTALISFQL